MRRSTLLTNCYAISEVVGALLLLIIAVVAAATIYSYMLPVPIPTSDPNVHLMGYVSEQGEVIIEHVGGEVLWSYEVYIDGQNVYTNPKEEYLAIGDTIPSDIAPTLVDENDQVRVMIYAINDDSSKSIVFDGILSGFQPNTQLPEIPPPTYSMPISTLRTNTVDEDLICYSSFVTPNIDPVTSFIYSWERNRGEGFSPLCSLLMPFDTNNALETKDYSGNNPNGTIYGLTWSSEGIVGGAYSYDGLGFISLPYCFEDDHLDSVTVEAWIKTSMLSGTIVSYHRDQYWELSVSGGVIKWTTNASDGIADTIGTIDVNDNLWHLITVTYDAITGDSGIYVDGELDTVEQSHIPGSSIGSGDTPIGFLGKGSGSADRETIFTTSFETQTEKDFWEQDNITVEEEIIWDILTFDDFAGGSWGNYVDGAWWDGDCQMSTDYDHSGDGYSVLTRDNSGQYSSFYHGSGIDVSTPEYTSILVDFWVYPESMDSGENFFVEYYNGWYWDIAGNYYAGTHFWNDNWYHFKLYINESEYTYPTNMRIRFRCDASNDNDHCYFDDIYVNATGGDERVDYDFDLRDASELSPHLGIYSIGGTGEIGIEAAAYNRTAIDISGYTDVEVSVWYSYKDTEDVDFFGLYYKDGEDWTPIFEENNPDIGSGQSEWTNSISAIPNYLESIELQFTWSTSSTTEFVAIDDLQITGIPPAGEDNFTGMIDELRVYTDVLSHEQIYQNYLCFREGNSDLSVIVSEETCVGDYWKCIVTPNNGAIDDVSTESDVLYVVDYSGGG